MLNQLKKTIYYHYYRKKNGWFFPPDMAHTAGYQIAMGSYEPEVTGIVEDLLTEGSIFIDIGANVGYFARLATEIVGNTGNVVAFEAGHSNYRALVENSTGRQNIIPLHLAVSNRTGFQELHLSSHSSCHSLVNTQNYLSGTRITMPTITLDRFWDLYLDRAAIDLVKIDVEGAELMVLDGMNELLAENRVRAMIVEYCPRIISNSGVDGRRLYRVLSRNFEISIIEEEFRSLQEGEALTSLQAFDRITRDLTSREEAVNLNLLCSR